MNIEFLMEDDKLYTFYVSTEDIECMYLQVDFETACSLDICWNINNPETKEKLSALMNWMVANGPNVNGVKITSSVVNVNGQIAKDKVSCVQLDMLYNKAMFRAQLDSSKAPFGRAKFYLEGWPEVSTLAI
jgi:hypothetical protein